MLALQEKMNMDKKDRKLNRTFGSYHQPNVYNCFMNSISTFCVSFCSRLNGFVIFILCFIVYWFRGLFLLIHVYTYA